MQVPSDLTVYEPEQLYTFIDRVRIYRQAYATQDAEGAQVRSYCKEEKSRIQAELKRRHLPVNRPQDNRTFGPGRVEQRYHFSHEPQGLMAVDRDSAT